MLNRRQINAQKQNLIAMCRISVKSLLDFACLYPHVDDDCEEFINFCAVFEQMVSHRLRPYQKKVWLPGNGTPRHFWNVLLENQNSSHGTYFQTCIPNIAAIETLKSPKAKLRAFIRIALMEKRLSDYMFWLMANTTLIRESYCDGAVMTSEEASVLCSDLIGLNAIDFNFCLKGNENELLGPMEISYFPFLKYKQMSASKSVDDVEMQRLSSKVCDQDLLQTSAVLTETNVNDLLRLQVLEKDFKSIKEQKDYLEELVRLRERQLANINLKNESARAERESQEREMENEHKTMHACILELQAEMSKLRKQNENLKTQVQFLKLFKEKMEMREVPMVDMAGARSLLEKPEVLVEMDHIEQRFTVKDKSKAPSEQLMILCDQRSIKSSNSDQNQMKEDTHSMIPLTGSLMEVNISTLDSGPQENHTLCMDNVHSLVATSSCEVVQAILTRDQTLSVTQSSLMDNVTIPLITTQDIVADKDNSAQVDMNTLYVFEDTKSNSEILSDKISTSKSEEANSMSESSKSTSAAGTQDTTITMETLPTSSKAASSTESDKEEEAGSSDPEMINKSNSSSDGGDNTWDMMSDTEHGTH